MTTDKQIMSLEQRQERLQRLMTYITNPPEYSVYIHGETDSLNSCVSSASNEYMREIYVKAAATGLADLQAEMQALQAKMDKINEFIETVREPINELDASVESKQPVPATVNDEEDASAVLDFINGCQEPNKPQMRRLEDVDATWTYAGIDWCRAITQAGNTPIKVGDVYCAKDATPPYGMLLGVVSREPHSVGYIKISIEPKACEIYEDGLTFSNPEQFIVKTKGILTPESVSRMPVPLGQLAAQAIEILGQNIMDGIEELEESK